MALAGRSGCWKRSGLVDPIDQTGGIKERVHLVDQLFDIERDLNTLLDIACVGAGLRRPRNASGMIKSLAHLREIGLDRDFNRMRVHGQRLLSPPHMLCTRRKSSER